MFMCYICKERNLSDQYRVTRYSVANNTWKQLPNYRPRSEGDNVLGSVRPSVCLSVNALTPEPFDLRSWYLVYRLARLARSSFEVKVVGQRSRSNNKNATWRWREHTCQWHVDFTPELQSAVATMLSLTKATLIFWFSRSFKSIDSNAFR